MKIFKDSVGIDVSKSSFNVCHKRKCWREGLGFEEVFSHEGEFKNDPKGVGKFISWLLDELDPSVGSHIVILESTNVYHQLLADELYLNGIAISVANPRRLKHLLLSYEGKGKTDIVDSQKIAQAGLDRDDWRLWQPSSKDKLHLRTLSREASGIQSDITSLKNRIDSLKHASCSMPASIKRMEASIKFLQKQRKQVLKQMRSIAQSIEGYWVGIERMMTIPGVGEITALCVVSETNGFEQIENVKQLCSYAGYDIVENQSGKFRGRTRISKRGNVHLRKAMYMPSISAITHFPAMKRLYLRVGERSGIRAKGRVAVQRKLLCLMYALWKSGESFDMKKYEKACQPKEKNDKKKTEKKQENAEVNMT